MGTGKTWVAELHEQGQVVPLRTVAELSKRPATAPAVELDAAVEQLRAAFVRIGLSESAARVAAQGRS